VIAFYSSAASSEATGSPERSVVLVLQYRPPLRAVALEFPAGLVDQGEQASPGEAGQRELREECGLQCSVVHGTSPAVAYEPGLTDSRCRLVTLEVDGDAAQPGASPEEDEFIQVLVVPLRRLRETCDQLSAHHAVVIDAKLYCFLLGLEAASLRPE
jgi:ADP-ribose diphosphatase